MERGMTVNCDKINSHAEAEAIAKPH